MIAESLIKRSAQADAQVREFEQLARNAIALSKAQHRVLQRTIHVLDEGSAPLMKAWRDLEPNERTLEKSKNILDDIAVALGWLEGATTQLE